MNQRGGMVPLEGDTLDELAQKALYNIQWFVAGRFFDWLRTRPDIGYVARARPPNRLYRVVTDEETADAAGRVRHVLPAVVVAYVGARRGDRGACCVHVLGVWQGAGSVETPLVLPPEALVDITDAACAGQLRYGTAADP